MTAALRWWQTGIIYQVYPRSFQDSNGDGVGDLNGIHQRLDYLRSLNVKTVWLSPIYPSPMHDFGYDVADYVAVHPLFGTLADFDRLLAAVHERDMKLVLDLVPNHTSDEHAWFVESRSSRANPKRDWYIWRDPAPDGGPPNNWLSFFGGPAWTYDEQTQQYYLHQFVRQQPELNYRNPEVLAAMLDAMRFWLDKGVDGFRIDVIWLMVKDALLRSEPADPNWDGVTPHASLQHIYSADQPEVHDVIRAMRRLLDSYDDRMMVGEIYLPNAKLMTYYGAALDECHLPFNFQLINAQWNAQTVRRLVDQYEADLPPGGWPNWVLGNHDQHRLATRVGPQQARVATLLLLTLRGTPTCYYGDEIGMENVRIPLELVQDPPAVNQPEIAHIVGRDPVRTPMQWDASANAGFAAADVRPWLPLADDYAIRNVTEQERTPTSMLRFFRALTALRATTPALFAGAYAAVETEVDEVFAYTRSHGDERYLVVLNFGQGNHRLDLRAVGERATIVLSTGMLSSGDIRLRQVYITPNEGLLLRLV
jgi:alpha-glucosidase